MKQTLSSENRDALVKYRLQRASEAIAEADYNANGGFFNTSINRLYYAAFYAASALLVFNNLEASTHAGVKTMLGLNFIRTGKLDSVYGRNFLKLYEKRQSGDYEDFTYCDQELYDELRPKAIDFIEKMKEMCAMPN